MRYDVSHDGIMFKNPTGAWIPFEEKPATRRITIPVTSKIFKEVEEEVKIMSASGKVEYFKRLHYDHRLRRKRND